MRFLLFIPMFMFASGQGDNYDIVERALNFLIFAAIVFYFLNKPLLQMYLNRKNNIAKTLQEIDDKLKSSSLKKVDALKRIEQAKLDASMIVENSKKEAEVLVNKIMNDNLKELINLEKSFDEKNNFNKNQIIKNISSEIINDIFDNINLSQDDLLDIMLKKVG